MPDLGRPRSTPAPADLQALTARLDRGHSALPPAARDLESPAMSSTTPAAALHVLLLLYSGWVNRHQRSVIDYLMEENRVLREQLAGRRLRLTDDQRRRLAVKGKAIGRKALGQVAGIVTPDTILRWYRQLVAKKYDGAKRRGPGRPPRARTSPLAKSASDWPSDITSSTITRSVTTKVSAASSSSKNNERMLMTVQSPAGRGSAAC